jgi:hypothetical protein
LRGEFIIVIFASKIKSNQIKQTVWSSIYNTGSHGHRCAFNWPEARTFMVETGALTHAQVDAPNGLIAGHLVPIPMGRTSLAGASGVSRAPRAVPGTLQEEEVMIEAAVRAALDEKRPGRAPVDFAQLPADLRVWTLRIPVRGAGALVTGNGDDQAMPDRDAFTEWNLVKRLGTAVLIDGARISGFNGVRYLSLEFTTPKAATMFRLECCRLAREGGHDHQGPGITSCFEYVNNLRIWEPGSRSDKITVSNVSARDKKEAELIIRKFARSAQGGAATMHLDLFSEPGSLAVALSTRSTRGGSRRKPRPLPEGRKIFTVYITLYGLEEARTFIKACGGRQGGFYAKGDSVETTICFNCSKFGHYRNTCPEEQLGIRVDSYNSFNTRWLQIMASDTAAVRAHTGTKLGAGPKTFAHLYYADRVTRMDAVVRLRTHWQHDRSLLTGVDLFDQGPARCCPGCGRRNTGNKDEDHLSAGSALCTRNKNRSSSAPQASSPAPGFDPKARFSFHAGLPAQSQFSFDNSPSNEAVIHELSARMAAVDLELKPGAKPEPAAAATTTAAPASPAARPATEPAGPTASARPATLPGTGSAQDTTGASPAAATVLRSDAEGDVQLAAPAATSVSSGVSPPLQSVPAAAEAPVSANGPVKGMEVEAALPGAPPARVVPPTTLPASAPALSDAGLRMPVAQTPASRADGTSPTVSANGPVKGMEVEAALPEAPPARLVPRPPLHASTSAPLLSGAGLPLAQTPAPRADGTYPTAGGGQCQLHACFGRWMLAREPNQGMIVCTQVLAVRSEMLALMWTFDSVSEMPLPLQYHARTMVCDFVDLDVPRLQTMGLSRDFTLPRDAVAALIARSERSGIGFNAMAAAECAFVEGVATLPRKRLSDLCTNVFKCPVPPTQSAKHGLAASWMGGFRLTCHHRRRDLERWMAAQHSLLCKTLLRDLSAASALWRSSPDFEEAELDALWWGMLAHMRQFPGDELPRGALAFVAPLASVPITAHSQHSGGPDPVDPPVTYAPVPLPIGHTVGPAFTSIRSDLQRDHRTSLHVMHCGYGHFEKFSPGSAGGPQAQRDLQHAEGAPPTRAPAALSVVVWPPLHAPAVGARGKWPGAGRKAVSLSPQRGGGPRSGGAVSRRS